MATGFYFDERCLWHMTGEHVIIAPVGGYLQPPSGGGHAENPETKRRLKNLVEVSRLGEHREWRYLQKARSSSVRHQIQSFYQKLQVDNRATLAAVPVGAG